MKPQFTLISFIVLLLCLGSISYGQLEVLYTPDVRPTIDGVLDASDPWQVDEWMAQNLWAANSETYDISSQFQLLWDDENIYLAVQVVDATPNWDHATDFNNDCVEAYFYMTGGSVGGTEVPYDPSTCQLRWPRGESTHSMSGTGAFVMALLADENYDYAVVSDANGWVLEVMLPIAILDAGDTFDGENFMFDVNTSDNTGEARTGHIFWGNNSDNQWQHVETFSPVHLSSFTVGDPPLLVEYTSDLAPTIDGVIDANDPWEETDWASQDSLVDGSTTDASSMFQLLWDDDNIYLGVQVEDATPNNDHELAWENDCIDAFFYMTGGSVEGTEVAYDVNTSQLRWPRGETTHSMSGMPSFVAAFDANANAAYAVSSDANGWTLEVKLPIEVLDAGGAFDGRNMMFEILTTDNSSGSGRTGQMYWHNTSDDQWRWVETFGPTLLMPNRDAVNYHFKESESICEGEEYSWRGNDYGESGSYYENYTGIDGGDSIYELSLQVFDKPESFIIIGTSDVVPDQIENYYVPINSQIDYEWDALNGSVISYPASNSAVIQWNEAGEGQVKVVSVNSDGCKSDTAKLIVDIGTGINEDLTKPITLYPNPARNTIILGNIERCSNYDIVDIYGKVLLEGLLDDQSDEIDLSLLKAGIYFLRIEDEGIHKIVKR